MPKYYLLRLDGSYSDHGDYPALPEDREEGDWVMGSPNQDIPKFQTVDALIAPLRAIINAVPTEGVPASLRASVRMLEAGAVASLAAGDKEAAVYMIESATIPEEFESIRTQLLSILN